MELVFATGNLNKLAEVQDMMPEGIVLRSLIDIGITEDIPETADTLEGNAFQKADYVFEKTGLPCFADDTGLEVKALGGRPGVFSARYAGPSKNAQANMALLLSELEDKNNRSAQFRTAIAYVDKERRTWVEGTCKGTILKELTGDGGFGYDPIFQPEGYPVSFAEMLLEHKNEISHRGRAFKVLLEKFSDWLKE